MFPTATAITSASRNSAPGRRRVSASWPVANDGRPGNAVPGRRANARSPIAWNAACTADQRGAPPASTRELARTKRHRRVSTRPASGSPLARRGHELDSHIVTYPHLTQISDEQLAREPRESREELSRRVGAAIAGFASPFGEYDGRTHLHRDPVPRRCRRPARVAAPQMLRKGAPLLRRGAAIQDAQEQVSAHRHAPPVAVLGPWRRSSPSKSSRRSIRFRARCSA